ncbi:aminotransferase class III-fold pyridoxal phosphate-dependent enzyme [Sporolactobacillus sp. THM7-4]|nr:aminotransferase class III-fold pyridoxal phosphate-dependent enzyme [Sporolactobacillus sp. THM7-4]
MVDVLKADQVLTGEEIQDLDKDYVMHSWSKQGNKALAIEKADGIYFWDYEGKRYTDMSSLLVCTNLGHNNKKIINAIHEQVDKMAFMAPAYATEPKAKLAKMLVDIVGENYSRVFFTNGGADANENAIKMARMFSGRSKILSRYRSYHGASLGAANASGDPRRFAVEHPAAPGFIKFFDPYIYHDRIKFADEEEATNYYLHQLEEQIIYEGPNSIAAILLESITGANGVIIPPNGYLQGIRKLCDKYGILMICDEVMAGFGRTGKMFAFQHWGIEPDLITFAKGVTCGYVQLGGVIVSKKISKYFEDHVLQCGLTYSGHTLACAAGVASVNYYYEHNILDHVNEVGKYLGEFLEEMKEKHSCVGDVRYIGLFSALELVKDKATREPLVPYGVPNNIMSTIMGKLKEKGFSTFGRENNINICPPLIITKEELLENLPILDDVLTWVDQNYLL